MNMHTATAKVALMGFDIDGVMTDGSLWFGPEGDTLKSFNSQDGHGIKMLMEGGVEVAIISGRSSPAVSHRARNLGVSTVLLGVHDKRQAMKALAQSRGLDLDRCGYMGDDVVDLPVLRVCGFSAAPADAHHWVRQHVLWVSRFAGGRGAVREVCEVLLEARGLLGPMLASYLE